MMTQVTSYETVKLRVINGNRSFSELLKKLQLQMVELGKEIPSGTDSLAKELQDLAQEAKNAIRVAIESEEHAKGVDDTITANVVVSKLRKQLALFKKPERSELVKWLQSQFEELNKKPLPTENDGLAKELQELAKQAEAAIEIAVKSEKETRNSDDTNKALAIVNQWKKKLALLSGNFGYLTGNKNGELVEGWNAKTGKYEFHHPKEWESLIERDGGGKSGDMIGGSTPMINLKKQTAKFTLDKNTGRLTQAPSQNTNVFIQQHDNQFLGTFETHIRWERESTQKMRKGMSDNVNRRSGKPQSDVANNCVMAEKLTGLITVDMLEDGGLLCRIVGPIAGQGQHVIGKEFEENGKKSQKFSKEDLERVIKNIGEASARLKKGEGNEGDANKIMQLIGCFTDGLTEVIEGKEKPVKQFDVLWPEFAKAFGLKEEQKENLLERVRGYKEIAGAAADTSSGKGTRKDVTRGQLKDTEGKPIPAAMPNDPRYKISDENALIKNDISGSMHSSLLAQEISESLLITKTFKGKGESVQIKEKSLIDARAYDALSLTAGGKKGQDDIVMHTAYEMINGMRAITGAPEVDEAGASYVIRQMGKGVSFTDAMEALFKPEQLPWLASEGGGSRNSGGGNESGDRKDPALAKLQKQMTASEFRLSREMDGAMYRPTDILDLLIYSNSEIKEFEKAVSNVSNQSEKEKLTKQLAGVKEVLAIFVQSGILRATEKLEQQRSEAVNEAKKILDDARLSPEKNKEHYKRANSALVQLDEQINDWVTQIGEGSKLGSSVIDGLHSPLDEMVEVQKSLEEAIKSLLPTLRGKIAKDDGTSTIRVPEDMVIKDEKDAERILIECKDWSEAKKRYSQYKSEMQKLANFRQKVVDGWLDANLRDKYGLTKGAGTGWVSVGSNDPTSDYDISINKHSVNADGTIRKYDYQMVEEFNSYFRAKYQCETGTIFDTNLYASAPSIEFAPRENESPEEKKARENIKASNDIGALMKQRRYMSSAEFNDYMVSVLMGIPEEKQSEVASRFQQADDNYRIALQSTVALLVKQVEKRVKELGEKGGDEVEINELKKLLEDEKRISSRLGSDIIGGADLLEKLAHALEHACKDFNTQTTNTLYAESTKNTRNIEGKINGLQACMKMADELLASAKMLKDLPENAAVEEREKLSKSLDDNKVKLAKAIEALGNTGDTRLSEVPKAIEEGRLEDVAKSLVKLSPELFEELGRALSLSMFYANEAYQSGGPLKHVVHAGQAVDSDVRGGAAKDKNDLQKSQIEKKKEIEKDLQDIKTRLEINMTATERPGADQKMLQVERDQLTARFGSLTIEVAELDKSINSLEDNIQALVAQERAKRRGELTKEECLDSFNEQLGDFLKDLQHYGTADPGVAIIQSSKYLDRLLDAASLIKERGLLKEENLVKEVEEQVGRMKVVQEQLIKARKGQIRIVPEEGGEPFTPEQELEQRRALACKIMSDWGINSVASLHRCYADLGKKLNIEVRKNMATDV